MTFTVVSVVVLRVQHRNDLLVFDAISDDACQVIFGSDAVVVERDNFRSIARVDDVDLDLTAAEQLTQHLGRLGAELLHISDAEQLAGTAQYGSEGIHGAKLLVELDGVVDVRAGQTGYHLEQPRVVSVKVLLVAFLVRLFVDGLHDSLDLACHVEDRHGQDRIGLETDHLVIRLVESLIEVCVSDVQRVAGQTYVSSDAFAELHSDSRIVS